MPLKKGGSKKSAEPQVCTESLLATETEKHATSKTLYGDSSARISGNVSYIHDAIRERAYDAVLRTIKGKTLLHLSCGMGLTSMMAARSGAEHVVAVDTSAILDASRVVIEQNGLTNITLLRGRLRDVLKQLPRKKFDVVLCEWMGALLLNDEVLEDVIYARDHLLAPNGTICPNRSSIHVAGTSDYNFRMETEEYWSNVYGFRMDPMKELVRREVECCAIPGGNIVTTTCRAHEVNIDALPALTEEELKRYEESAQQAEEDRIKKVENPVEARWKPTEVARTGFSADFSIQVTRNATIDFLTFFVDATFHNKHDTGSNFVIGIRPGGQNAWTEVSVPLKTPLPVNAGETVTGSIKAFTPVEHGGKITVLEVVAHTEGKVVDIESRGEYVYQAW